MLSSDLVACLSSFVTRLHHEGSTSTFSAQKLSLLHSFSEFRRYADDHVFTVFYLLFSERNSLSDVLTELFLMDRVNEISDPK